MSLTEYQRTYDRLLVQRADLSGLTRRYIFIVAYAAGLCAWAKWMCLWFGFAPWIQ
jgi:hypothetical protein